MELRHERGAGRRRAAPGRLGLAAGVAALYLAAGAAATWPALQHAGSRFLAASAPAIGEPAPGDHLQTGYRLWLVGHQLGRGAAPWLDPYTFQPEVDPLPNFAGWPFGLPYWPLHAAFGDVGAWNAFVLLGFVLAGAFAFCWLRALGLPDGGALAGGLAFALAPYRVEQSTGHLLGPVSVLLPLALWALERGRTGSRWWLALAAAATASVPLSGQVHLAIGTTAFVLAYALVRAREAWPLAAAGLGVALAVAVALAYRDAVIAGSIEEGGRSLAEVAHYSAGWRDFVSRTPRHGSESFVFLGWATPVAAAAGLVLLARARRFGLLALLGLGALVPLLLALGTNLPGYETLWHHVAPFRFPRVPERLLPVACLALAGLVGVAVARLRHAALVALALVALVADLRVDAFAAAASGPGHDAYAAASTTPGRLLELPVFLPGVHYGSVYLYFDMQARRERPLGYALGPDSTDALARRLAPIGCGDWSGGAEELLSRLGVGVVAVHSGLYRLASGGEWFAWRGLREHGFGPLARDGEVTTFARGRSAAVAGPPEPDRATAVRCGGWGRDGTLSVPPGELWAHGPATLRLRLDAAAPVVVFRDGREVDRGSGELGVVLRLGHGWHLVRIEKRGDGPVRLVSADRG